MKRKRPWSHADSAEVFALIAVACAAISLIMVVGKIAGWWTY